MFYFLIILKESSVVLFIISIEDIPICRMTITVLSIDIRNRTTRHIDSVHRVARFRVEISYTGEIKSRPTASALLVINSDRSLNQYMFRCRIIMCVHISVDRTVRNLFHGLILTCVTFYKIHDIVVAHHLILQC